MTGRVVSSNTESNIQNVPFLTPEVFNRASENGARRAEAEILKWMKKTFWASKFALKPKKIFRRPGPCSNLNSVQTGTSRRCWKWRILFFAVVGNELITYNPQDQDISSLYDSTDLSTPNPSVDLTADLNTPLIDYTDETNPLLLGLSGIPEASTSTDEVDWGGRSVVFVAV